jgi:hypothetical protein
MIRPAASGSRNKIDGVRLPSITIAPVFQADLGGGMNTMMDPADLAANEFTLQVNGRSRLGNLVRRTGKSLFVPLKPNTTKVLGFYAFNKNNGSVYLLRFNPLGIHLSSGGVWNAATGTALAGGANDRFTTAIVNDRFFFTNNGVDNVKEYNPTTNAFATLGDWDKYKFVTGFGNRVLCFNLLGGSPNPVEVRWSGLNNYGVSNPLTDKTAGFQPLVESSSDLADFGTGIFGFSNTVQIFRERSIWEGILTGSPTQPYKFYTKVPSQGSDAPYTIKRVPFGLTFLDARTRNVYVYTLDGAVTPIGDKVRDDILNAVTDPKNLFASYHPQTKEYQIALPDPTTTYVRVWTFSFEDKTWSYDELENLSSIDVLDYSSSSFSYNDLLGSYNQLIGTYDSLINTNQVVTKFFGYSTGELAYETSAVDNDWGTPFTTIVESKDFELPTTDEYIAEIRFDYQSVMLSNINLEYSVDGGDTWKSAKSITAAGDNKKRTLIYKKLIRARRFKYRVTSSSGLWKITSFECWVSIAGDSRK